MDPFENAIVPPLIRMDINVVADSFDRAGMLTVVDTKGASHRRHDPKKLQSPHPHSEEDI